MLLTRLSIFNDQAEYYHGWKETFKNIVLKFGANSNEEIDMLLKWLGPNSKCQAMSQKCAYIADIHCRFQQSTYQDLGIDLSGNYNQVR